MSDRDYLGRANGEGDSPEQQQAVEGQGQLTERPDDAPDQQPVPPDTETTETTDSSGSGEGDQPGS